MWHAMTNTMLSHLARPSGWARTCAVVCSTLFLTGCICMPRNETWDRVTDPGYSPPQHRELHGYHRTTWDCWPEEWGRPRWSRTVVIEDTEESLPSGKASKDLPTPETPPESRAIEQESPAAPDHNAPPQTNIPKRAPRAARPPRHAAEQPLAEPVVAEVEVAAPEIAPEVEPVAAPVDEDLVAEPLEFNDLEQADAAPVSSDQAPLGEVTVDEPRDTSAPWKQRLGQLIASDRKSGWKSLDGNQLDIALGASKTLSATQVSHEEPLKASITARRATVRGVNLVNEARLNVRSAESAFTPTPTTPVAPLKKAGDGAVKLRMTTLP